MFTLSYLYPFGSNDANRNALLQSYTDAHAERLNTNDTPTDRAAHHDFPLPAIGAEGIERWHNGSEHRIRVVEHYQEWYDTCRGWGTDFRLNVVTKFEYIDRPGTLCVWLDRWNRITMQ